MTAGSPRTREPGPSAAVRRKRRGATRRMLTAAVLVLTVASAIAALTYRSQALHVAAGILANETAIVGTKLVLVAGQWARTPRAVVNPSYDSPEALTAFAAATSDPRWPRIEANSRSLLQRLGLGRSA